MTQRVAAVLLALMLSATGTLVGVSPAAADTVREHQWWLGPMRIEEAHKISQGEGVVVGVVDTAVDGTHPDLAGQILKGSGTGGAPADGWGSFAEAWHGTAVAGVIVGRNNYVGVAPKAKVLPFATPENSTADKINAGIRWVTDNGAKVINLSVAGAASTPEQVDAIRYALEHDVVVVAGAGNVPVTGEAVGSPADIPGVIAVSGMDRQGSWWPDSSRGPEVALAAPSVEVIAPTPYAKSKVGYSDVNGTSVAAPFVAGIAALIRSKYPQMKAPAVINRMLKTARDNGAPGRDPLFGFGAVRAYQALTEDVPDVETNPLGFPDGAAGSAEPTLAAPDGGGASSKRPWLVGIGFGTVLAVLIAVLIVLVRRRRRPAFAGHAGSGHAGSGHAGSGRAGSGHAAPAPPQYSWPSPPGRSPAYPPAGSHGDPPAAPAGGPAAAPPSTHPGWILPPPSGPSPSTQPPAPPSP
jgi:type VII secretion-associated serine protease mycosin